MHETCSILRCCFGRKICNLVMDGNSMKNMHSLEIGKKLQLKVSSIPSHTSFVGWMKQVEFESI